MFKKGVSLYFVMVILFLLLGVALGISTVITSQIVMIRSSGDSVIAEAAAESGTEEGLYVFFTHGFDDTWVLGLSGASNTSQKKNFSLCGMTDDMSDNYRYTGAQQLSGSNSMYRYRFFYNKDSYTITSAGYYPANKQGKDISLRVVSASWK